MVNLTSDDADAAEKADAERAGLHYFQIPMTTHEAPTPAQITTFLALVADPANEPIYVHCVGGRHRTGVMTAIYRMTHDGWDAARAFAEMKRYKFGRISSTPNSSGSSSRTPRCWRTPVQRPRRSPAVIRALRGTKP